MNLCSNLACVPPSGRPTLSDDEVERVTAAMRELRDGQFKGNVTAFARAIGRSQPSILHILNGRNKPSYDTAKRVAKLLGMSADDLMSAGAKRADQSQERPAVRVPVTDRYPNRALVRERSWYLDEPEPVRQAFEAIRQTRGDLPSPHAWLAILQQISTAYATTGSVDFVRALFPSASEDE